MRAAHEAGVQRARAAATSSVKRPRPASSAGSSNRVTRAPKCFAPMLVSSREMPPPATIGQNRVSAGPDGKGRGSAGCRPMRKRYESKREIDLRCENSAARQFRVAAANCARPKPVNNPISSLQAPSVGTSDLDSLGGIGKAMRVLLAAIVWSVALLAASPDPRAAEPSAVWKDGWTINTPGGSNWLSDGTASRSIPGRAFGALHAGPRPGPLRLRRLFDRPHAPVRPRLWAWRNAGDVRRPHGRAARPQRVRRRRSIRAVTWASARASASRATSRCSLPGSSSGRSALRCCPPTERSTPAAASQIRFCRIPPAAVRRSTSTACSACHTGSTAPRN